MNLKYEFINECKVKNKGTLLEFGTCTGDSTEFLAVNWKEENGKIITIDGWEGLPKSQKVIPDNWTEGTFKGNKIQVTERLSIFKNVEIVDSWINELKDPIAYNVGYVVGSNIDVDIYESTIDSLMWLDKCDWVDDEVVVRFDDWDAPIGGRVTKEVKDILKQHNQLAYSDFLNRTGNISECLISDDYCAVFKLKRKK